MGEEETRRSLFVSCVNSLSLIRCNLAKESIRKAPKLSGQKEEFPCEHSWKSQRTSKRKINCLFTEQCSVSLLSFVLSLLLCLALWPSKSDDQTVRFCSKQFMICNFAEVTLPMNHRCAFDCKWWSWKTIIFRLRFVVLVGAKGRKSRNLKWSIGVISRCDILANDLFHFGKAQWGPVETEHFGEDFLSLYWCFWRKTIWEVSSISRFKF